MDQNDTTTLLDAPELTPASTYSVNSNPEEENEETESRKLPQYIAALSAMLSALSAGIVLGWTSPILSYMESGHYHNITVNDNQMGWIGSFVTIGGMFAGLPAGFLCDLLGTKRVLMFLIVPFTLGWLNILFAKNLLMLYFGRLFLGLASGASCVAAPLYTNEISEKEIRGTLGSYFQLMVTVGVFLVYVWGKLLDPLPYTALCSVVPVLFTVIFAFQPESPIFYLRRSLRQEAAASLERLRGRTDNQRELCEIEAELRNTSGTATSFRATLRRKANWKAMVIAVALMFFQQFSGINAVILYTSDIFQSTGVKLDPNVASIIVGAFQAAATFLSSLLIERTGRKILLFISSSLMSTSVLFLAIFFTLKFRCAISVQVLNSLSFIPILSLCIFVVAFSIGLGPVPWLLTFEIFTPELKSVAGAVAGTINWSLAFIITKFYLQVCNAVGQDTTFYVFCVMSLIGAVFVKLIVPETKGKTIEEVQAELER